MSSLKAWQINLNHYHATSLNLEKETKNMNQFIILAQEPWIHIVRSVVSPPAGMSFRTSRSFALRPVSSQPLRCPVLSYLSSPLGIRQLFFLKAATTIVLVSCYLPYEGLLPPLAWQGLVDFCRHGSYCLVMGCDANAHDTGCATLMWKQRTPLAEFLAASDFYWCNTLTLRVANRSEIIDIILTASITLNRITNWQVSGNLSLSHHVFITTALLEADR